MKSIWFIWHGARDQTLSLRLMMHGPHGSFKRDILFKPRPDGKVGYEATEPGVVAAILASSMYADQRRIIAENPADLVNAMPRKLPRTPRGEASGQSFEDIAARLPFLPIAAEGALSDAFQDPEAPADEVSEDGSCLKIDGFHGEFHIGVSRPEECFTGKQGVGNADSDHQDRHEAGQPDGAAGPSEGGRG